MKIPSSSSVCVLALILQAMSFGQTSSEAVSESNPLGSGTSGIDLLSGTVNYSLPIYIVPGRGGLDADIKFAYSSDIFLNVKANNQIAPTRWLGLGWAYGSANIRCEDNGTISLDDDECSLTSSVGARERILRKKVGAEIRFYLENSPFLKVARCINDLCDNSTPASTKIQGWKVTDMDGKVFWYGDFTNTPATVRNATRYKFSWEGHSAASPAHDYSYVGNGFSGTPQLYAYQWDLAKEVDVRGQTLTYEYSQFVQAVTAKNESGVEWTSPIQYTKASYLKRIVTPDGLRADFIIGDKDPEEFVDPYAFKEEDPSGALWSATSPLDPAAVAGDAFMENFETKFLDKIQVFHPGTPDKMVREFKFNYSKINQRLSENTGNKYVKRLLIKVTERLSASNVFGDTYLGYYDSPEDDKSAQTNFGALKSVRGQNCGTMEFVYTKLSLGKEVQKSAAFDVTNFGSGAKLVSSKVGTKSDYVVIKGGEGKKSLIWVYNWNNGKWRGQKIWFEKPNADGEHQRQDGFYPNGSDLGLTRDKEEIYAFDDYFVVVEKGRKVTTQHKCEPGRTSNQACKGGATHYTTEHEENGNLSVFRWRGNKWYQTNLKSHDVGTKRDDIISGQKDFFLYFNKRKVFGFRWKEAEATWTQEVVVNPEEDLFSGCAWTTAKLIGDATLANNHILIKADECFVGGNQAGFFIKTWNGTAWQGTYKSTGEDNDAYMVPGSGPAGPYVLFYDEENFNDDYINSFNWDGTKWVKFPRFGLPGAPGPGYEAKIEGIGDNYFLLKYDSDEHIRTYHWNGGKWIGKTLWDYEKSWPFEGSAESIHGYVGRDYFAVTHPFDEWEEKECCPCFGGCCFTCWSWHNVTADAQVDVYRHKDFDFGFNSILGTLGHENTPKRVVPGDDFFVLTRKESGDGSNAANAAYVWDGARFNKQIKGENTISRFVSTFGSKAFVEGNDNFSIHHKIQNSFYKDFFVFAVTEKKTIDPIAGEFNPATGGYHPKTYKYDYNTATATYDPEYGSARFNEVTVTPPGTSGKSKAFYFNGSTVSDQLNANADLLIGASYRTENYSRNNSTIPISISTKEFEIYESEEWPIGVNQIRETKSVSVLRKVKTETVFGYNAVNGLVNEVTRARSDGNKLITQQTFAFEIPAYAAMKDLNLLAMTTRSIVYENEVSNDHVLNSNVKVFTNTLGGGTWEPYKTYTHMLKKPELGYVPFSYADLPSNLLNNWALASENTKSSPLGVVLESVKQSGVYATTLLGRNSTHLMAIIQNAKYGEVGVFTGDYQLSGTDPVYFDALNGWKRGDAALDFSQYQLGDASIHVEGGDQGPSKQMTISQNTKPFVFSAWVYSPEVSVTVDFHTTVPHLVTVPAGNAWNFISVDIPAAHATGTFEIRVGPGNGKQFFVNDIRFHPASAQVVTHYYSKDLFLDLATVDTRNIPTFKEWDAFGRPVKEYMMNRNNAKMLMAEKIYHDVGCRIRDNISNKLKRVQLEPAQKVVLNFNENTLLYDINVPQDQEKFTLYFEAADPDASVEVKINGVVSESNLNRGTIEVSMATGSLTTVDLTVEGTNTYSFKFSTFQSCWAYHNKKGVTANRGSYPSLIFNKGPYPSPVPTVAFRNSGAGEMGSVVRASLSSTNWDAVGSPISQNDIKYPLLLNDNSEQPVPYVAYLDQILEPVLGEQSWTQRVFVKKYTGSSWNFVGSSLANPISKGNAELLSFAMHGSTPYVAYLGENFSETGTGAAREMRVFVKYYDAGQDKWLGLGPNSGRVSTFEASSVSLAVSASGVLYLAYVGPEEFSCSAGIFECPAGQATIKPKLLIVRKWNGTAWTSVSSEYASTGKDYLLGFTSENAIIKVDGELPYLAYGYEYINPNGQRSGERTLVVRKFNADQFSYDNSHWIPIANVATPANESEARIVFMNKASSDFDLEIESGTPYLAFISDKNKNKVTVIRHNGAKWLSIGNPGFQDAVTSASAGENLDMAMNPSEPGHPYVAIITSGGANAGRVGVLKFCDPCKDASMKSIDAAGPVQLEWDFKQYFLSYRGTVSAATNQITFTMVPNNCADIGKIIVYKDGTPLQTFTSTMCAGVAYTTPLTTGINRFSVRGIDNEGKNSVEYTYDITRPFAANTLALSFAFSSEDGAELGLTPLFSVSNSGPYALPGIPETQSFLSVTSTFPEGVDVIINDNYASNGNSMDVQLAPGTNTIKALVYSGEKLLNTYTFEVKKTTSGDGDSPVLSKIVDLTNPETGSAIGSIYSGINTHIINITSEVRSISITKAVENTAYTEVDGVELVLGQAHVVGSLQSGRRILVNVQRPGLPDEPHVLIINIVSNIDEIVVIGKPEAGEPAGFYDYRYLSDAHITIQTYLNTANDSETPRSYVFYAIADRGMTEISSPDIEIVPFSGQQKNLNIVIYGIRKDSPEYTDLLQQHQSGHGL